MVKTQEITIRTKGNCEVVNITDQVEAAVGRSEIRDGAVTVFNIGSTDGVREARAGKRPLRTRRNVA